MVAGARAGSVLAVGPWSREWLMQMLDTSAGLIRLRPVFVAGRGMPPGRKMTVGAGLYFGLVDCL